MKVLRFIGQFLLAALSLLIVLPFLMLIMFTVTPLILLVAGFLLMVLFPALMTVWLVLYIFDQKAVTDKMRDEILKPSTGTKKGSK